MAKYVDVKTGTVFEASEEVAARLPNVAPYEEPKAEASPRRKTRAKGTKEVG